MSWSQPPARFNLTRALNIKVSVAAVSVQIQVRYIESLAEQELAAKRAEMSGRQHQMRQKLKLESEGSLSEVRAYNWFARTC